MYLFGAQSKSSNNWLNIRSTRWLACAHSRIHISNCGTEDKCWTKMRTESNASRDYYYRCCCCCRVNQKNDERLTLSWICFCYDDLTKSMLFFPWVRFFCVVFFLLLSYNSVLLRLIFYINRISVKQKWQAISFAINWGMKQKSFILAENYENR